MDLIDRQALLKKLFPYEVVDKKNCAINAYAVEKAIMDMPPIKTMAELCKDCIHTEICHARIVASEAMKKQIIKCEFYKKGDDNG